MQTFHVDSQVVEEVWNRADIKPFEQISFNDALRRIFGLNACTRDDSQHFAVGADHSSEDARLAEDFLESTSPVASSRAADRSRKKAPRANLAALIKAGVLHEGQELFLVDYQGNKVSGYKATVSGRYLRFFGELHSMSALARELLKREGFRSNAVRGPRHWATDSGDLISDLWESLS